jgi:hypothetical protein
MDSINEAVDAGTMMDANKNLKLRFFIRRNGEFWNEQVQETGAMAAAVELSFEI